MIEFKTYNNSKPFHILKGLAVLFLVINSFKTLGQDNLIKNPKLQTYDFSKYPNMSHLYQYNYYNWQTCKDWFCPNPYAANIAFYNIEIPIQYQIPNYIDSCASIKYNNRRGEACPGCRDVTEITCDRSCDESVMVHPILWESYWETATNVDDSLLNYAKSNNLNNFRDIDPSVMYGTSRQYISTELKESLIVGQTYVFKFDIAYTNGRISNFFGAALTTYKPLQKTNEQLNIKPQFQQTEGIKSQLYQTVEYVFLADSAYRFLTIGCFLKNSEIIKKDYTKLLTISKFLSSVKVTNFSLMHKIIVPKIIGPRVLCFPQIAQYYSTYNSNLKWYKLGEITPFYIGDTLSQNIVFNTTLVAESNGFYDTFTVSVLPPFQKKMKDTFFFTGLSFKAIYPNDVFKLMWDNISKDSFKHKIYLTPGYKFAKVTNYYNCSYNDSFYLTEINPAFKILADSVACMGISSYIRHSLSDKRHVKWQIKNNQLIASEVLFSNDILGTHQIKACYDTMGYTFCDSINLTVVAQPSSNLPTELVFCKNEPKEICPQVLPNSATMLWWDNSNIACKTFSQQGVYTLAMNHQGCLKTDTLITKVLPVPQFNIFQNDTPCLDGQNFTLLQIVPDTFKSFYWQPSGNNNVSFVNYDTSSHVITVTGNNNCINSIRYKPINNCKMTLFVPSAFSPNKNGTNDVFKVQGHYIQKVEMSIYNRWGEKIFETKDLNEAWDGSYKGEIVQEGIYLVKLKITSMPQANGQTPHAYYEMTLNVLR